MRTIFERPVRKIRTTLVTKKLGDKENLLNMIGFWQSSAANGKLFKNQQIS